VVGAGIGGLAAGIALSRAGWEVTVYEAASELRPLGAGLSVWPNGVRALRALGLGAVVAGAPRTGGALRRADGSLLAEFDPATIEARFGAPLVGMHRAELHEALVGGLGAGRLRLGMPLESLDGEQLRFADGSTQRADLIVGADGIDSTVRAALIGDGAPRDSGIVAFRGVAEFDGAPAGEWWAPGAAAGLLPLGDGRVYWYLAYRGEPDRDELKGHLGDFEPTVQGVVTRTAEDAVLIHRLYDRDPVSSWSGGGVTLLGDAVHPMLPFLGQGACSALEDAVALGTAVAVEEDLPAALAAYERARVRLTAGLVKGSRRAARAALFSSGVGRRLRDTLVRRAPESARLRQLDPIVGRSN
jgi:2-polyprenyl-6-methoxyphenol hydroxylase-like FAD-dependent oxidoreductase